MKYAQHIVNAHIVNKKYKYIPNAIQQALYALYKF